ncbi:hypothetical protein HX021_06985 [Sphingobacterium sp. N143]|uniref:hypothetical protein n=1 Tax=Sphingobacterium sp. N143 TaxID=2746727 RepID=UPI002577701A|nr:hypothetical protein [Sphingobacterium sp. N143]MDM1294038.1 hypothetical protein [Sphingobacterium sp. N143]
MQLRQIIFLFFAVITFSGCDTSLLVQSTGVLRDASRKFELRNGARSVLYIPMRHLGTRVYYDQIQHAVDSLQKAGYVVFYESIAYQVDSAAERDLYDRKFRKLTGNRLGLQQCIETPGDTSRILRAPMYRKLGQRIISQPDYSFFLVNYETAVKADIPKNRLLDDFEYLYGEIKLEPCDYDTPLNEPYGCKPIKASLKNRFDKEFVMRKREENLASLVADAPQQKILILFGTSHFKGFLRNLQARDPRWIKIK